jgi:TolB-like protein/class 3 adenylate cyclase/Flp pilus assembly protein TadD
MPDQNNHHISQARQLAAIMFTDISGYSSLMGKDADKALDLVRKSRKIQKPLVEKFNGKWLKEMGDGALAQFSTSLEAVKCALEIQKAARAEFDGKLRIGIHSGDINIENDDVFGDGVNIAARLESITDPGGIYISESVERSIRNQSGIQAKYLGEVRLKNIDYGVRTYALQGTGLPLPDLGSDKHISGRIYAELQRRGVLRAGVSYIALSITLLLFLPYFSSILNLPGWVSGILRLILLCGFPISVYLAWKFERSPSGFVRTTSKESWRNPYSGAQRKPLTSNFILGVLMFVIVIMYVFPDYFKEERLTNASNGSDYITDKSIAVLPFDNLSNDPDQDYISDGMMEAILNHLNRIEGLRLTSRTTMMTYKDSNKSIPEIASEVAVNYVLEGSVLRADNTIRITAQLIDGQSDNHIWSDYYDGEISDLLNIQSDIAQRISEGLELNINIKTKESIEHLPTNNARAYDLYLNAINLRSNWDPNDLEKIKDLLEEAIELDPEFSLAYTELAGYWTSKAFDDRKYIRTAENLYNKSLRLDPNQPKAHRDLANLKLWYEWDFLTAEREMDYAVWLEPSNNANHSSDLLCALGRFEEALKAVNTYVSIEPNNGHALATKAMVLYFNNRPEEAIEILEVAKGKSIKGNKYNYYGDGGRAYLYMKEYQMAVDFLEQGMLEGISGPRHLGNLAIAYYHLGDIEKSNEILVNIPQAGGISHSIYIAMNHAQRGEIDTAFQWLDSAYKHRELDMWWIKVEPPFEPLHNDPRWQVILDKVGFPD